MLNYKNMTWLSARVMNGNDDDYNRGSFNTCGMLRLPR